jgi:hypothetical protein
MTTIIATKMTPQGLLIPRDEIQEWAQAELEAVKSDRGIMIRPKALTAGEERALDMQILEEAGLLLPVEPLSVPVPSISAERQANLVRKLSVGKPLSEVIIEEREDRA